jgi:hypothetical protein
MKFYFVLLVCCMAYTAGAQTQFFHPFGQERSLKEIQIQIPSQSLNAGYYHTSVYNDMFTISEYSDHYLLSSLDYYKEKKVAQVKITDNAGVAQFVLDISKDGRMAKTTLNTALLREDQFFYDETGKNTMTIKSYSLNNLVLRIDTIRYSHQKKIINDTIYTYTAVQLSIHKSGSFLNQQNQYYNDTYGGVSMENNSLFSFSVPPVYSVKGKGKGKGKVKSKPSGTIYVREKYPVNYAAYRFYFSRQQTDVEDYSFTFQQHPVNPGEEAIYLYVPELKHRDEVKYGDLACERFDEPRFMRQAMYCGTSARTAPEYNQMSRYYTFSHNNNNLQDTCFSTWGSNRSPQYYFTYAYFE